MILSQTNGNPVVGASFKIGEDFRTYSDSLGFVNIVQSNSYGSDITINHIAFAKKIIEHDSKLYIKIIDSDEIVKIGLEPRSYMMPEVITTGNFAPTSSQQSVFDVDVISKEQIDAQKAPTLREILQNQANIRISNDAALGSGISINGISGANVKVLIDGVPQIGRENGNINADHISMSNVEQIEIIEGPMSALYGTDAAAGVINIITSTNSNNDFSAKLNSYVENAGTANTNFNSRLGSENHQFSLDFGRNFFSGWNDEGSGAFRSHQWNPKEQLFGNFRYDNNFEDSKLTYKINVFDEFILSRRDPIDSPYNETGIDDEYSSLRINNSIFYKGLYGDNKYFDITGSYLYYRRERQRFIKDLVSLERNFVSADNANQVNDNGNLFIRAVFSDDDFGDNFKYQLGAETNFETLSGVRILDNEQSIQDAAIFLSTSFKIKDRLVIQPMLRGIYNSRFNAPLVPALNLKYDISNNFNFRAGITRGFRAPNLKELYLEFVDQQHFVIGNENLSSETNLSLNGAVNYSFVSSGNVFRGEAKYFYNHIQNRIFLALNGFNTSTQQQIYSYQNVGEFKTSGGEIGFSYFRDNFTVNLAATYIGSQFARYSDNFFYSPEYSANVIYYFRELNFNMALIYKYTGSQISLNQSGIAVLTDDEILTTDELSQFEIPSFQNLDLTLTKTFWNDRLEIIAGVKNIFDVTNLLTNQPVGGIHSGDNTIQVAWGRTFFGGINFNIK